MATQRAETSALITSGKAYAIKYGTDDDSPSKISQHVATIGMLGSIAITVNSLTGPAMLDLPATFQRSGLIPTIACLLFVCALSAMCSLHIANTISKVPGNLRFTEEVEYSDVFRNFGGNRWFIFTHIVFFVCGKLS